jgi:hypothetical protein
MLLPAFNHAGRDFRYARSLLMEKSLSSPLSLRTRTPLASGDRHQARMTNVTPGETSPLQPRAEPGSYAWNYGTGDS